MRVPPRWLAIILYWVASVMLALVAGLMLGGCATEQYWFRDAPGVPHRRTAIVQALPQACQAAFGAWGCVDRDDGTVYLLDSIPDDWRDCIIAHERTHLDGWNHSDRGTLGGAMCDLTTWREMR